MRGAQVDGQIMVIPRRRATELFALESERPADVSRSYTCVFFVFSVLFLFWVMPLDSHPLFCAFLPALSAYAVVPQ